VEYGLEYVGTPLVVVLGHQHCGAVTAAVEGEEATGQIPELLREIEPAVRKARGEHPGATRAQLIDRTARNNVWQAVANLFEGSPLVASYVREGKAEVHGAYFDLENGQVQWLGEHPQQAGLMMH
jgi:carbonic anhydrase